MRCYDFVMGSLSEIEAAIEQLPVRDLEELATWLASHRLRLKESVPVGAGHFDVARVPCPISVEVTWKLYLEALFSFK